MDCTHAKKGCLSFIFLVKNKVLSLVQILPTIYCAQEFGAVPSYACSSIYYKGIQRNGSPPWRPDDKDGHYVFAIGENLTPRCKYTRNT